MTTEIAAFRDRGVLSLALSENLAVGVMLLGIVAACVAAWFSKIPIPIEQPAVLAVAATFLLIPSTSHTLVILGNIIGIYLLAVPFNEIYARYAAIPLGSSALVISYSLWPLLLCAAGSLLMRRYVSMTENPGGSAMLGAWLAAIVILLAHMIVLAILFHATYGYGYEDDLQVLAHLSLYFLLFLVFWQPLGHRTFRQPAAIILAAFYLLLILKS